MIRRSFVAICLVFLAIHPVLAEDILIKGGTVHTVGPAGTLTDVDILVRGPLIVAIEANIEAPPGARVIDAANKVVVPGFMHPHSLLGLSDVPWTADSNEHSAEGSPFDAAFDVRYGYNAGSPLIADNRRHGLTRSVVFPGRSGGIFRGTGVLIALDGAAPAAGPMVARLADGGNRNVAWAKIRMIFDQVRGTAPGAFLSPLNMRALVPVLDGDRLLALQVASANDIRQAIALKRDYGVRLVLVGATEAWLVAPELARADIPVVISPVDNTPRGFGSMRATNSNAALLAEAGVLFAIAPAVGTHGSHHTAHYVSQYAGIAVAHGLSHDDALKAITLNPARIYGIDDKYGSLEVGKEADIVVWDGDPLEVTSHPDHVIVRGTEYPLISRRTLLRDRYRPR